MQSSRISAPPDRPSDEASAEPASCSAEPDRSSREPATALVFVYGSLKRGFKNHAELAGATFEGPARTAPAYRLVLVGEYPGLALGDRSIQGELYRLHAALLSRLDEFEGDGYTRAPILLGDRRHAEAYLVTGLALTASTTLDTDTWQE